MTLKEAFEKSDKVRRTKWLLDVYIMKYAQFVILHTTVGGAFPNYQLDLEDILGDDWVPVKTEPVSKDELYYKNELIKQGYEIDYYEQSVYPICIKKRIELGRFWTYESAYKVIKREDCE